MSFVNYIKGTEYGFKSTMWLDLCILIMSQSVTWSKSGHDGRTWLIIARIGNVNVYNLSLTLEGPWFSKSLEKYCVRNIVQCLSRYKNLMLSLCLEKPDYHSFSFDPERKLCLLGESDQITEACASPTALSFGMIWYTISFLSYLHLIPSYIAQTSVAILVQSHEFKEQRWFYIYRLS